MCSEPRNRRRRRCHEFNPTRGGCLAGHLQHLGGTAGGRDDLRGEDGGDFFLGNQWENMAVCQNLVPLVNIKIAGKWMFIPLKMVLVGIDPYPYGNI